MSAISSYFVVTDTARPPAVRPAQTGPITIHCAAMLSAQCNYTHLKSSSSSAAAAAQRNVKLSVHRYMREYRQQVLTLAWSWHYSFASFSSDPFSLRSHTVSLFILADFCRRRFVADKKIVADLSVNNTTTLGVLGGWAWLTWVTRAVIGRPSEMSATSVSECELVGTRRRRIYLSHKNQT